MSLELGIFLIIVIYGQFMYWVGWWDGKKNKDKMQFSFGSRNNKQVMS